MSNLHTKRNVISSLVWKFLERGGTQGIQFLIQLILARILSPQEFGTISLVLVFINLAQVFVQSGLNTALIQNKDVREEDFSSILYVSLLISVLAYTAIYFTAPLISRFYNTDSITMILRVISLSLFFSAFNSIQVAYLSRNLLFKKLFKSSISSIILSGIIGIALAYTGFGVWSLVIQYLLQQVIIAVMMYFTVEWKPKLIFSLERVKDLFSFGWKIFASSFLNILYLDIRTLVIGSFYSSATLGHYNRGEQFPRIIAQNINGTIQSVILPTLSAYQRDNQKIKNITSRAIVTSSFIVFPMMIGLFVVSKPLVILLLTEKWLPAVPYLQIFCISYLFYPIHTANLQAINAIGRSDVFLKLELIKKSLGFMLLIIAVRYDPYMIALSQAVNSFLSTFINAYPNKKLLNYDYLEQSKDILPIFLVTILMGVIVYPIQFIIENPVLLISTQVLTGILIYLILSKVFKIEAMSYLISTISEFRNNK